MPETKGWCLSQCLRKCFLCSCFRKSSSQTNEESTGAGDQDAVIRLPASWLPPSEVSVMPTAERWTSAPTFINLPPPTPPPPPPPTPGGDRPRKRRSSPGRLDWPTVQLIASELQHERGKTPDKLDLEN